MKQLFLFVFLLSLISSCKKSEIELTGPNTAPPDGTIENVTIENYITRTYILVLGREPDNNEFISAKTILTAANADSLSRRNFVGTIFNSTDYYKRLYDQNRIDLLNNLDTSEISNWIFIFQYLMQDSAYYFQWPLIQYEIDRLNELRDAFGLFTAATIDIIELQQRMVNNYFYDQINMGSANFVISTFQHLLNRNPTYSEQQSGILMVDGNNSSILFQTGSSKADYLNIITGSTNYYEAQVVLLYQKYLHRNPGTVEMSEGTLKYMNSNDYTSVQKDILCTDEFLGI
jgi:hypothetical protein